MVPTANLVAFALAALLLVVIPGPSVLFVIGRALEIGRVGALLSVVGNAAGMLGQVVAIALGLGAILERSIVAFTVVKLAGAAFLVYLGVQAIRHRHRRAASAGRAAPRGAIRSLAEGAVVGVTNPKSVVFFIAVLPQFVDRASGSVPLQLIELGVLFALLALVFDSLWALGAGFARDWFGRSPRRLSRLGATGGVAMIGLGVGLAATGSKQ
ncbi:threonine/homoserine/homoserine lactone efflux protein [Conyzicola lurida]|uniref:Threonine/homoserine/homoserine lactone efflux protein n=1 Tax=Conyzicola lurida TaxID=1172621 RepID=A0A841AQR8_9MICO|nr:LysE family translocator [Conyzicola lurida]MBB5844121.1 threonine/homoserine/homoserine lactone efflux protein [Conyzicola lurida]